MEGWAERKGQWPQNGLQLCNDGTNEGLIEKANDVPMVGIYTNVRDYCYIFTIVLWLLVQM